MNKEAVIDWGTVLKLLAGGAVTGAGIGAGTSFMRYLNSLQDQAGATSAADDDVLYLDLPARPEPEVAGRRKRASTGTFAVGGLAGILGTLLAYNAVRNMYQKVQKKQLQKELDASQNIYMGGLTTQSGLAKGASQFGLASKGIGTVYLALLLAGLGSGVVANQLLKKTFPPVKSPNRNRPRKIVIRTKNPAGAEVGEEQAITPAGGVTPDVVESLARAETPPLPPDAMESLVRTNMSVPKVAQYDGMTSDLVVAAASGRCNEIRNNIAAYGLDATLDMVKGARHENPGALRKHLAATWVCNDPLVSAAIEPIVAAEFYDWAPGFCKLASYIPEEYHDNLVGLAAAACQEVRATTFKNFKPLIKSAVDFTKEAAPDMIQNMILANTLRSILDEPGQNQDEDQMQTPDSQTNVPISEESPVLPDIEMSGDDAKKFWKQYGPMVDTAMEKLQPPTR